MPGDRPPRRVRRGPPHAPPRLLRDNSALPLPRRYNPSPSPRTLHSGKWLPARVRFKSPCVRLSAVVSARSKVPAHRSGKVVIGDGIGEELARLLLGEEITEVEPPAAPLEREARVAVPVAGGREAARARAG